MRRFLAAQFAPLVRAWQTGFEADARRSAAAFLILVFLTRWVSLGSCWAAASFPFATWFVYQDVLLLVLAVVIGGLILWQHRTNIVRLVQGKENKLTFHKKNETGV